MSRFLIVVPPWGRHVRPTVPVGTELAARGHTVAWSGHPDVVGDLLPTGAAFLPVDSLAPRLPSQGRRGPAAVRTLWEDVYLPLAYGMAPGVQAAVDAFRPDTLIVDQHALAGAAVATRQGRPWVTTMATTADVADPVGALPLVARWIRELLGDLLLDIGVPADVAERIDLRFSPHLVVAFMIEALVAAGSCPRGVVFVGPSLGNVPGDRHKSPEIATLAGRRDLRSVAVSGDDDRERPLVLLDPGAVPTLATVRLLALASQALAILGARPALLTADSPRSALLRRAAAVVGHGDPGAVDEALVHGVPLVLVPQGGDQPIVAARVVAAGAGVRVRLAQLRVDGLRDAIATAIFDPTLRAGAARLRDAYASAGGPRVAADRIEGLAAASLTVTSAPLERKVSA